MTRAFQALTRWQVCFAGCKLKFIITGKQLALKIVDNPYTHQGFLHKVLGVFYMVKTRAASPFVYRKQRHVTVTVTLFLIITFLLSASGFPVIIKFYPATCKTYLLLTGLNTIGDYNKWTHIGDSCCKLFLKLLY